MVLCRKENIWDSCRARTSALETISKLLLYSSNDMQMVKAGESVIQRRRCYFGCWFCYEEECFAVGYFYTVPRHLYDTHSIARPKITTSQQYSLRHCLWAVFLSCSHRPSASNFGLLIRAPYQVDHIPTMFDESQISCTTEHSHKSLQSLLSLPKYHRSFLGFFPCFTTISGILHVELFSLSHSKNFLNASTYSLILSSVSNVKIMSSAGNESNVPG